MLLCPMCHRHHDDPPSPGRNRVCILCDVTRPVALHVGKTKTKKRRSKQTAEPMPEDPPKTE